MKRFDKHIRISIETVDHVFTECFAHDEKVKDSIDWLKDIYCIEEDSIVRIHVTYTTTFKRNSNGNN